MVGRPGVVEGETSHQPTLRGGVAIGRPIFGVPPIRVRRLDDGYRARVEVRRVAGVIAVHDARIVLVRECHERWGGAFWNIPSGMVESRESPTLGAARELAEETGLLATPGDLHLVGTSCSRGIRLSVVPV